MPYRIIGNSPLFNKQIKRAPLSIIKALRQRIDLFTDNPYHPLLHNHILVGKYKGCRSINITGDWRALYIEQEEAEIALFIALGTHSQLYK